MTDQKLIHWTGTPQGVCARKDAKADEWQDGPNITYLGVADHLGNVTCPVCKSHWRARQFQKRKKK